jgi:hypothetical protein
MYPSQPVLSNIRPQRILLVGRAVDLFRDALHLARDVRPTWFFEVVLSPEAATRTLDDHEVDVVVAAAEPGSRASAGSEERDSVRLVAMATWPGLDRGQPNLTLDAGADTAAQLAALDTLLSPPSAQRTA